MGFPRIVCPDSETVLQGFTGRSVALRVNGCDRIALGVDQVRKSGNLLFCIIVESDQPLADMEFDDRHQGIPLAVMAPSLGRFRDLARHLHRLTHPQPAPLSPLRPPRQPYKFAHPVLSGNHPAAPISGMAGLIGNPWPIWRPTRCWNGRRTRPSSLSPSWRRTTLLAVTSTGAGSSSMIPGIFSIWTPAAASPSPGPNWPKTTSWPTASMKSWSRLSFRRSGTGSGLGNTSSSTTIPAPPAPAGGSVSGSSPRTWPPMPDVLNFSRK